MCNDCWTRAGNPTEWTPQTARFLTLATDLYEEAVTGGPLHSVLDDWNVSDSQLSAYYDDDTTPGIRAICEELLTILHGWTETQRYAALAYFDGFLPRPQEAAS